MNNKWFIACLVSAFTAGIVLSVLVFLIFSKPVIEEKIVYTHSITTVEVNENAILKNIVDVFDSIPNNKWMGFRISYQATNKIFRINLDYNERAYTQEFKSYDDFILFISDRKLYYDDIMSLGK